LGFISSRYNQTCEAAGKSHNTVSKEVFDALQRQAALIIDPAVKQIGHPS
jgi:hypothetical protein